MMLIGINLSVFESIDNYYPHPRPPLHCVAEERTGLRKGLKKRKFIVQTQ
jgi:hypothetical protein